MRLLQVFQHRECLCASVLGGNLTGNEHKGNERAPPEHAAQIEAGVLFQPVPGGDTVLYLLGLFL